MARLRSDLTRLAALAPQLAKVALLQTAADILEVSQQLVPVDTGALKQSGGADVIDSFTVRIGYGNDDDIRYAKYVEYGTSVSAAQPFLTPAFAQSEETFKARIAEKFKEFK
jgi:HK97 gp10 family phage protein